MVFILGDRTNLQTKRIHERIKQKIQSRFDNITRRIAEPREPGSYRVIGEANPQLLLDNENYPADTGRVEIGFRLRSQKPREDYWINWIEPERNFLVGWHQDDTHQELGEVHLQINYESTVVDRQSTDFINSHPLDVVERRLNSLPNVVLSVRWEDGEPAGFDDYQI